MDRKEGGGEGVMERETGSNRKGRTGRGYGEGEMRGGNVNRRQGGGKGDG